MAEELNLIPAKKVASYNRLLRLRRAGFLHAIIIDGRHFYDNAEVDTLQARISAAAEKLLLAGGAGRRGRPGYRDME